MAFTTLSALITTITGMTVTGVASSSRFGYRPRIINDVELPILYTRLPSTNRQNSTLGYQQGLKMGVIEIVILVEMMNLNTQEANDAQATTLIDALAAALETNASSLGMDSYSITTEEDTIGDGTTPIQAIVATVEVSG